MPLVGKEDIPRYLASKKELRDELVDGNWWAAKKVAQLVTPGPGRSQEAVGHVADDDSRQDVCEDLRS